MAPHTAPASGADTYRGSGRKTVSEIRTPSYNMTAALAHPTPSSPNCEVQWRTFKAGRRGKKEDKL